MSETYFAIIFPAGKCGLEILHNPVNEEFKVGTCHSDFAKTFASVLQDAKILSINWTSSSDLTSMQDIQQLFLSLEKVQKRVVFVVNLSAKQIQDTSKYDDGFELLNFNERLDMKPSYYKAVLRNRPLGFTIAASPTGGVEVVQVDSVHQDKLKLGSKLIAVNGRYIKDEKNVIESLLRCFMPVHLVLEVVNEENLFAPEEKHDGEAPTWLALSGNSGDMIELNIHWFSKELGKEDFVLLIKPDATVAEIRAKIAVTSQLKFNAVKLIAKGVQLKDNNYKLCDMNLQDNDTVTVVVSQTTQLKDEEKMPLDYKVEMRIIGAFLKSCDKALLHYLWDDIDHDKKEMLHITELDRLLARFMGLYERTSCIRLPMEYEHGSVKFSTIENLGLVIEGNEVIMCHPKSQAERQGILAGWKVVGAEYKDRVGRMVKFPVDHKSCLRSLKRAKKECANNGFQVLCLIPKGQRYETMMVMKKQAIADLNLNDVKMQNTITRKHYEQLPDIFAMGALRLSFTEVLEASDFCSGGARDAIISKDTKNEILKTFTGVRVLAINSTTVAHMNFGDIMKALLALKPPHFLTLDVKS
jgi:hypothetical protein